MSPAPAPQASGPQAAGLESEALGAGFAVRLEEFAGPFEVLLTLIGKHELDITTLALSAVTDEFLDYVRGLQEQGSTAALDASTEFMVVAATLLDLKAARLLPRGEVEDLEDLELLEARDLLFARLLQYKAFKDVSQQLHRAMQAESQRHARRAPLEPQLAALLPELVWTTTPEQFAQIALRALTPRAEEPAEVGVDHLHGARVTVREEAENLRDLLADGREHEFTALIADAADVLVVVVRFMALLELFRDRAVDLAQERALGPLRVTWTADEHWSSARLASDDAAPVAAAATGGAAQPGEPRGEEQA